jgi:hypothetical protein
VMLRTVVRLAKFEGVKKWAKFTSKIAFSSVASLLASAILIPLILRYLHPGAWVAYSLGLTTGTLGATLVGWGFLGVAPSLISHLTTSQISDLFHTSLVSRIVLAFISAIAIVSASPLLAPGHLVLFISAGLTQVTSALTASWVFVGRGSPTPIFFTEALPRLVGAILAASALMVLRDEIIFATIIVASQLGAIILSNRATGYMAGSRLRKVRFTSMCDFYKEFRHNLTSALFSLSYMTLPTLLVAVTQAEQVASFSLAERLLKYTVLALSLTTLYFQNWVHNVSEQDFISRSRTALGFTAIAGIAGALIFALFAPIWASILSHGRVKVDVDLAIPFAGVVLLMLVSQFVGNVMLAHATQRKFVAISAVAGSIFFLSASGLGYLGLSFFTTPYAIFGAELVVLIVQVFACIRFNEKPWAEK